MHHGGAGTTASGLLAGCPTTVVFIFGARVCQASPSLPLLTLPYPTVVWQARRPRDC